MIAGKGHEKVQILKDGTVPFDDVAVAARSSEGDSVKLTLGQVADWIHAEGDFDTSAEALGYGIDSRTIGAGELFFAVKGERLDGHDFVATALADGAVAAVVSMGWVVPAEVDETKLLRVPACEDCVLTGAAEACSCGSESVGWAGNRGDGVGGEDDDQGGCGAGAVVRDSGC